MHDSARLCSALLRPRMGAEDDAVACLECQERLEDRSRGRVGRGGHPRNESHRLCHPHEPEAPIVLHYPASLRVLVGVVDVLGGELILDHLIFHHPHSCLLRRHLGKRNAGSRSCRGRHSEDDIDLLLGKAGVLLLSGCGLVDKLVNFLLGIHRGGHFCSLLTQKSESEGESAVRLLRYTCDSKVMSLRSAVQTKNRTRENKFDTVHC
mmetsp:Transcript_39773/g.78399  ORF Transcript_39773/g.78399 Transcript_39773/m.78399 type:complete len:208 (-) Transcript_39773:73-696(-)